MKLVSKEEYKEIMNIFKNEMSALAKHEGKNSYFGQVAINCCYTSFLNDNQQLFIAFTPGFICIIENDYIKALKNRSECFGTGDANDILMALYKEVKKHGWVWSIERYNEYLSHENYCLLLCKKDGLLDGNILRIDLYRQLKPRKDNANYSEFVGGIFHALKHFSVNEQCASMVPNQKVNLYDVEQLIWPIAKAFYEGEHTTGKHKNTYETSTEYLNKIVTLEFYREGDSNVSFVNSVIPKSL